MSHKAVVAALAALAGETSGVFRVDDATNGRAWHDDPVDYENDNEKWSVPGRYGYKLVFATWKKVTETPGRLITEIGSTLGA